MVDESDPFVRLRELSAPDALLDPDLLARILEVLPDALFIIDEQGSIRYLNGQAELLFGYARTELLGGSIDQLLPSNLQDRHEAHRKAFFADPRSRPMGLGLPLRGKKRNGTELVLEINLTPLVTSHGVYAVAVVRKPRAT